MDKRLVGQWYKEELGETLNIFDECPLRMKMSFSSSGHYNFPPNCVYEKDGFFCYEINDEYYRMVYHVKIEDGKLVGYYTQFGEETKIVYEKVSDTPEDKEYEFISPIEYVPHTDKTRLEILREYSEYDNTTSELYSSEYKLGGEIPEILLKYDYSSYASGVVKNSDEIVFKILDFVCDHFGHNGQNGTGGSGVSDIIKFTETNDGKTNCRGLSIMLAALLRYNGVKARHITCMPYEDPFDDCHVVVDCLLPSGKRIMIDPSWRLYFKGTDGEYVSLRDLRNKLIKGEEIIPNKEASYNGYSFDLVYYRNYMTKNTFRFSRGELHADGVDVHCLELIPLNYDTEKFPNKSGFVYNENAFWMM